jgi:hypothetical protein
MGPITGNSGRNGIDRSGKPDLRWPQKSLTVDAWTGLALDWVKDETLGEMADFGPLD